MSSRPTQHSLAVLSLFLLGCLSLGAQTPPAVSLAQLAGGPELVSEFPCPDPQVFHDGSDWYIFGTGARPFFLQGREFGVGKMRRVQLEIDYGDFASPVHQVWGMVVQREPDGRCYAYGTLHLGNYRTVIASFVPKDSARWEPGKPVIRWRLASVMVGDVSRDDCLYYESKVLQDTDGSRHLMYVARVGRDNHIVAQRMKSPTELDASAKPRLLLRPTGYRSEDRNGPGSMQLVEGSSIARLNGKYVLLYSVGDFRLDNYKLGMAFSDSLIPPEGQPYRTVKVANPGKAGESGGAGEEIAYLLQSEKLAWPNYCAQRVVGPGLGSVVFIDGKSWLFFHGYKPDDAQRRPQDRFVFRAPLSVTIGQGEPRLDWLRVGDVK